MTMYWKALSNGTMPWDTAFGGECIGGHVDNELIEPWGRQWGHIAQLRNRTVLGAEEVNTRQI